MLEILRHSVLASLRGGFMRGGWGGKILLGIVGLYFTLLAIAVSYILPEMVNKYKPEDLSVISYTASFALYYILGDLAFRFASQELSSIQLRHYALLPIPFKRLVNLILGKSLFNFLNLIALIVFLPFAKNVILPESGFFPSLWWLVFLIAILLGNTLLGTHLKRLFASNTKATLIKLVIIGLIALTEWYTDGALQSVSQFVFSPILSSPLALLFFAYPVLAYKWNHRYLLFNRYEERWRINDKKDGIWSKLDFNGESLLSVLVANEWKLILRHKRTRSAVFLAILFLFYGVFFYKDDNIKSSMFIAVFMLGSGALNYGQYLIAWEARYFDGILTRPLQVENFFLGKWRLLIILNFIPFVFSLLYGFKNIELIPVHFAAALYNIGFNTYLLMFLATYQRKPIDLNAGSALNYQGTSALQFLMIFPLILLPLVIYGLFSWPFGHYAGLLALVVFSVLSLVFHRTWIKGIATNFREKKYLMADSFRQRES